MPLVITEHSSTYASGVPRWLDRLTRKTLMDADARVVVSPSLGRLLESRYGNAAGPWDWVPNMVDERLLSAAPARAGDRSTFRFLTIGNLIRIKGQSDLLRAFAQQFKGNSRAELRIGGGGPLHRELERLATSLGIRNQVTFLGRLDREQVAAEVRASDAFILSSHHETFGVVLIEALACGRPVVSTACGGPECIVHPGNGVLVPPGDPQGLGVAMAAMMESATHYDADSIQRDCRRRFSRASVVARLSAIYRDVIDAGRPTAVPA